MEFLLFFSTYHFYFIYLLVYLFVFYFLQLFGLLKTEVTELMRSFYTILKKNHNLKINGICLVVLIIYKAKKNIKKIFKMFMIKNNSTAR